MVHRIECNKSSIDDVYYQRNLVVKIDSLIEIINKITKSKYSFGTLKQSIETNNHLHITFDDGYKEHLIAAKKLIKELGLQKENCSFAINIGNSLLSDFSGMDLIYDIIQNNSIEELCNYLSIDNRKKCNIEFIKELYIKMSISEINMIKNSFKLTEPSLKNQFLNKQEVFELSKLFNIISHGVYHRDLRYHMHTSLKEMINSKKHLEELCNKQIDVFCYPEGKNNEDIWQMCKNSGYKYGLSIAHEPNNPYKIGRYCINRDKVELLRDLNDT